MGIDFSSMGAAGGTPVQNNGMVIGEAVEVSTPQGVTLDLSKAGTILDLNKKEPGMKKAALAAGWSQSASGQAADLDISAIMLDENDKIHSADDIIYFKHMNAPGINLNRDDTTGGSSADGDDEVIDLMLDEIPQKYKSILFAVNIYDAVQKRQTFGMIDNAYVRLLNKDSGESEVCRISLKGEHATSTAVIFAKLKRDGGSWQFESICEGLVVEDLNGIIERYM